MAAIFPGAVATQAQLWIAVNGISTTLNGAIDSLVTTINVIDTTSFPSTGYIVIDSEIISYTGKTGTSFTGCTRGADGTSAASHATAAVAAALAVADHHNILTLEMVAIETLLGSNTSHVDLTGRPGYGIKLTSPDGTKTVIVGVDNDGNFGIIG